MGDVTVMCFISRSSRLFVSFGFRGRALAMEKERNDLRDAQAQTVSLRSVTPKLFLAHQLQVLLEQFFFIIVMVFAPHQGDLFLLGSYNQGHERPVSSGLLDPTAGVLLNLVLDTC